VFSSTLPSPRSGGLHPGGAISLKPMVG
jgi:hypothetical protein